MGRKVEVSVLIPASIDAVWEDLARLESHAEWMRDAVSVEFVGSRRSGRGTKMRVPTRVGPFRTVDVIEIVDWQPPHRIGIVHDGRFSGEGAMDLRSTLAGTVLTWSETVRFPAVMGGPVGATLAAPILRRLWQANLRRFAARFAG